MATVDTQPKPTDSIGLFGLSIRVTNALRRWDIWTVADLLACSGNELLDIPSFGPAALYEVIDVLADRGLELKPSAGPLPARRASQASERAIREQVAKELRDYAGERGEKWMPLIWETIRHCANLARGES